MRNGKNQFRIIQHSDSRGMIRMNNNKRANKKKELGRRKGNYSKGNLSIEINDSKII